MLSHGKRLKDPWGHGFIRGGKDVVGKGGAQFLGNTPQTAAGEGLNYLAASSNNQVKPERTRETSQGS